MTLVREAPPAAEVRERTSAGDLQAGPSADLLAGRELPELPELSAAEIRRYSRHLVLPEVGVRGQRRLKASRVVIVGAGGLGSPLGLYLAAAGVGTLGLVEFDVVDESNLQRQVLYGVADIGRPKLEAAIERLQGVNPHVDYVAHPGRLTADTALEVLAGYDVVVDGSDNFATRYLVNDACVLLGKPDVYGSIYRFEGQVAVFWGAHGPCYRCLFPEPPPPGLVPSCAEGGVLGVLPGVIGALQASEAIKLLLAAGTEAREEGSGERAAPDVGRLVVYDALALRFRELRLEKDPRCPVCSERPTQTTLVDYDQLCADAGDEPASEEETAMPATSEDALPAEIGPRELDSWRAEGRDHVLLDVRTPPEIAIGRIEGSTLIPLAELPGRLEELDPERPIVAHCHHGIRSAQAVALLRSRGFQATNLAGGIDAWSAEVDPTVPRY